MSLERTPERSRRVYTSTVQRLNSRWDVGLPEVLVVERSIGNLDDEQRALQRRCSKYVEYLSWRPESGLDRLLDDFDELAGARYSSWLLKPSQEKGTLPSLPISKTFLRRDVVSKTEDQAAAVAGTSSTRRQELLTLLETLLREEKELAQESDAYTRSAAPSTTYELSQPLYQRDDKVNPKRQRSDNTMPPKSAKKRKPDETTSKEASKRKSRNHPPNNQTSILASFRPTPVPIPTPIYDAPLQPVVTPGISFNSTTSPVPSPIFSPAPHNGQNSSTDTSFDYDDDLEQSQYGVSTQAFEELCMDPSFTESLNTRGSVDSAGALKFIAELTTNGPFRQPDKDETIPQRLPFFYRYECHRLAQIASIPVRKFYEDVARRYRKEHTYDSLWESAKVLCATKRSTKLAASDKSSASAWETAQANFQNPSGEKSVVLSGVLSWSDPPHQGILTCKLNPLRMEKSCRFERRFGSDRFLYLSLPYISTSNIPKSSSDLLVAAKDLHVAIARWISRETHFIAGRQWRVLFIEPSKRKPNGDRPMSFKICLFATDGIDFVPVGTNAGGRDANHCDTRSPLSIGDLIDWHIPIAANMDSKDLKTFQRLALGLSRTYATVVLEQDEFVYLPDDPTWYKVMNDGCARMSSALADDIAAMLDLSPTPSVFQGRISGAKGLWMVEYDTGLYPEVKAKRGYWIEVTKDQLKIKPHPMDRTADPDHRTFEVLKWTGKPKIASLNIQLMGILSYGGVPRDQLKARLCSNTSAYLADLLNAMKDPRDLRLWIQQNENGSREGDINILGAFPRDGMEQVKCLLESGFSPRDNEFIVSRIRSCLKYHLEQYVERLQIKIEMSTSVWCVPDPYDVLGKEEVHMNFSEPWKGPNGRPITNLHGIECIVFRSPGYLPSDAQRVRCVYRPELDHLQNVIIFSRKDHIPLAHKLSGGDYDGDMCWVCFDQEIVKSFNINNKKLPPTTQEKSLLLVNRSKPLTDHFSSRSPAPCEVDSFLFDCFYFNLHTPMLGACSTEHEKLAYHRKEGIADAGAMKLAALAGYLVDAPKSGHYLSWNAWIKLKKEFSGVKELAKPAYKTGSEATLKPESSIIDYLKMVARQEQAHSLRRFNDTWPGQPNYDITLSTPFNKAEARYTSEKDEAGLRILHQLKKDLKKMRLTYSPELSKKGEEFTNAVTAMHADVLSIEPLRSETHAICARYAEEKDQEFSNWSRLRASCLYKDWSWSVGVWYATGKDLAKIKADMSGSTRTMVSTMHQVMKLDQKLIMRMAGRAKEDEEEVQADMWTDEVVEETEL